MSSPDRIQHIDAWLLQHGWEQAGRTRAETVRVPTQRSPVYGGLGGEIRTFGGRRRLRLPGTSGCATVGLHTTCLYRQERGRVSDMTRCPSKALSEDISNDRARVDRWMDEMTATIRKELRS